MSTFGTFAMNSMRISSTFRTKGVSRSWSGCTTLLSVPAKSGFHRHHLPFPHSVRQSSSDASSPEEIPYTHPVHATFIRPELEKEVAEKWLNKVKEKARRDGTLFPSHHPLAVEVTRVGSLIVEKAADHCEGHLWTAHMQGLDWEFTVIDDATQGACAYRGGKVLVYTGLFKQVSDEDELAGVLAHEVAHILARHGSQRVTENMFKDLVRYQFPDRGTSLLKNEDPLLNSRRREAEADRIGQKMAACACFDPSGLSRWFQKLHAAYVRTGRDKELEFNRTHPLPANRFQQSLHTLPLGAAFFKRCGCCRSRTTVVRYSYEKKGEVAPTIILPDDADSEGRQQDGALYDASFLLRDGIRGACKSLATWQQSTITVRKTFDIRPDAALESKSTDLSSAPPPDDPGERPAEAQPATRFQGVIAWLRGSLAHYL